ncbi:hypothetical protein I2I11_20195 [Pontibacter sp. 172403-2]|uniref:hypothetical protein n=1 Tax=Pontibacter rufus TaxID=2791028 RepID=UPI0018AF63F5|nr:hypothetical protein [Pontibacter sp. 172403-2]MBF9255629.1 hypothetical protein [Pontibacter sp. 172403-2]
MIRPIYKERYSALEQYVQQIMVQQLFPGCKINVKNQILLVDFTIKDPDYKAEYHLQVQYISQSWFKVFVLKPKIIGSVAIHMYPDNSLCLYYPPDISLFRRLWVGKDLIPMAALWICHYEQWLINGNIWKGREAPGHDQLLAQFNSRSQS